VLHPCCYPGQIPARSDAAGCCVLDHPNPTSTLNNLLLSALAACSAFSAASIASDDPTAEVLVKIECGDHKTPLEAEVLPVSGKLTVPSGSIVTSASIRATLAAEYEGDYYCADCDLSGFDLDSSESSGTFSYELEEIGVNTEVYSWTSSDVAIVISCSPCS